MMFFNTANSEIEITCGRLIRLNFCFLPYQYQWKEKRFAGVHVIGLKLSFSSTNRSSC